MAIDINNITFAYPKSNVNAVENVTLHIEQGERVAIIGQNGAGKSTLVKLMNNLYKPQTGGIVIDGEPSADKTTAQVARKVGYVFQNPDDQIFNDNVIKEIEYVLWKQGLPEDEIVRRREDAIRITELGDYLDMHPFSIPLPIRKFLTIAIVLAANPDYIILDEPTAGQDNQGRARLRRILNYLGEKGKTIITISHDMEYVAENFSRVVLMAHKNVLADDTAGNVFYMTNLLEEAKVMPPMYTQIAMALGYKQEVLTCEHLVELMKQVKQ